MSDFRLVKGFEEVWRSPAGRRVSPREVLHPVGTDSVRPRLARIAARTPEVMVKVTGRTRDHGHLAAHLRYITRQGELVAEDRDGLSITGRREVDELAADWTAIALTDRRRGPRTPISLSIVLSMPAATDPIRMRDAASAFARETFGGRHDYVFVLHTDAGHPHVHLSVRALGDLGERLNPKKADLEAWRQAFARTLRDRGIAAEATPRRARGVTLKAERTPIRKLRERHEGGGGAMPHVRAAAYREAARAAFGTGGGAPAWEVASAQRQRAVRATYLAQARILKASADAEDVKLGRAVEAFVQQMPAPDSQRLALARELREANEKRREPHNLDLRSRPAGRER